MKVYEDLADLDEAFYRINREFLVRPSKIMTYRAGVQAFTEDLIIKVASTDCTINLHHFGFSPERKWNHLIRSYVDPIEYEEFWQNVIKSNGTSLQFRFKKREGPNGPCLIALVLTRAVRKGPWTSAKVMWRTSELQRKFAADMVLINRFFAEIPEEAQDFIKLEGITLYLAQAYQSSRLIGPMLDFFANRDEIDKEHLHSAACIRTTERDYEASPRFETKYAPVKKMRALYDALRDGSLPEWTPEDISLRDEIEKLKNR